MEDGDAEQAPAQRTSGVLDLWALGVGAVISADFSGWQGVLSSGFGSALVATAGATLLYMLLATSVAEVASIKGTGGGPYQFALACFGRRVAFLTGLAESLKCIIVVGVINLGCASYMMEILHVRDSFAPAWWLACIGASTALNALGGRTSQRFQMAVTSLSVLLLLVFYIGVCIKGANFSEYALRGKPLAETISASGVISVWPTALWFYVGIEELPLATDMALNPTRSIPRSLKLAFATLALLAFSTLFASCSIPPGVEALVESTYPLLLGYRQVFGDSAAMRCVRFLLVVGLLASLHSFVFASGQVMVQLADDGWFPRILRKRSEAAPYNALMAGSAMSFLIMLALHLALGGVLDHVQSVGIAMCFLCSVASYMVQLSCFLYLRVAAGELDRPFGSCFGVGGAAVGMCLCAATLAAILYLPVSAGMYYLYGLVLALVLLGVGSLALLEALASWQEIWERRQQ